MEVGEAKALLETLNENEDRRFSTVVSNPPYQIGIPGNQKSLPIWDIFLTVGESLAETISIIAPSRWRYAAGHNERRILSHLQASQRHLRYIAIFDPSDSIFPGTLIRDGVGVIHWSLTTGDLPLFYLNGEFKGSIDLNEPFYHPTAVSIFKRVNRAPVKFLNYTNVVGQSRLRKYSKLATVESTNVNDVRVLGVFGGLGASRSWRYMDRKTWNREPKHIFSHYKFGGLGSAGKIDTINLNFCREGGLILSPGEFMGEGGRFIFFSTKQEAEHMQAYFQTKLVSFLVGATVQGRGYALSKLVPDLGDYTDANPDIDWAQPLDPQLYRLFNLTAEEIALVEGSEEG